MFVRALSEFVLGFGSFLMASISLTDTYLSAPEHILCEF